VSAIWVAAALAVAAGALLQAAVGFGFSLVCAPLVFAATTPERAIGLLMVLGLEMNLLTLASEGRRPAPLREVVVRVIAWALPGMLAGVAVLRAVDKAALQIALTAAVFVSLGVQRWARRHEATRPAPAWATPLAGLASGALTTSTSASGPPLILLLRGRGASAEQVRDTLTACFLALAILGSAALALTGTHGAVPTLPALAALLPLVFVAHLAGRRVFRRLAAGAYETVLTVVLVASAIAGLLVALL
jgi:uncharacterized membrane protein YfcA